MKQFSLFIHLMLSVLLFSSCGGKSKTASVIEAEKAIPLRYAENLSLSATEDYTIARLRNGIVFGCRQAEVLCNRRLYHCPPAQSLGYDPDTAYLRLG